MMMSGLGIGTLSCKGGNMRMRLAQAALTPFHGLSLQQEIAIHEHNEQESPMNQVMDTQQTPNLQIS